MTNPGAKLKHLQEFYLFFLCLFCSYPPAWADTNETQSTSIIKQDRFYLESSCPKQGIQEIILRKDGSFELTSFFKETKLRKAEIRGHWQLDESILTFSWEQNSMLFKVRSRVHNFMQKKFLFLSFKVIPDNSHPAFNECEFVDRRILDNFLKSS